MNKITLIIEENSDGYWAQVKQYPGVFTSGSSLEELKSNAIEAVSLFFDATNEDSSDSFHFEFVYDIREFFELNDYINITKLAKRSNINPSLLRQYAKGIKYPGEQQIEKIQTAIREIGEELRKSTLIRVTEIN